MLQIFWRPCFLHLTDRTGWQVWIKAQGQADGVGVILSFLEKVVNTAGYFFKLGCFMLSQVVCKEELALLHTYMQKI